MIKNYIKSAWRSIWKNKWTSILNIIGLSIGMTAAVFILLWVQNETNFDDYKDRDEIYRLTTSLPALGWVWENTPLLLAGAIHDELPEVQEIARLNNFQMPVFKVNNNLFKEKQCAYVDANWFHLFPSVFLEGNSLSFNKDPLSIILTKSEAENIMAKKRQLGKQYILTATSILSGR